MVLSGSQCGKAYENMPPIISGSESIFIDFMTCPGCNYEINLFSYKFVIHDINCPKCSKHQLSEFILKKEWK